MGATNGRDGDCQLRNMGASSGNVSMFNLQIGSFLSKFRKSSMFAYVVYVVFNVFVLLTLETGE